MDKFTKEEREQAKERLRAMCRECAPDGASTLLIACTGSRPSFIVADDRSDCFSVEVLTIHQGRPVITGRLNHPLHVALGYRQSKDGSVEVPGYGYSKAHHIASEIASLCGHPVQVNGSYQGVVR